MSDPAEAEVLRQNEAFYAAFEAMDLDRMSRCWAGTERDTCVHPGWEFLVGWPAVRESWRAIFAGMSFARFEAEVIGVSVSGDVAWVSCVENMMMIVQGVTAHSQVAATNIFHRRGGRWRMVLHHGSPMAHSVTAEDSGPAN